MYKKYTSAFAFILLCLYAASSWSVILDVRNGLLHGAQEIQVGSQLLDVSFQEGTCIGLFDGCDETSDFFFSDITTAHDANLALLNQVFVDTAAGLFDSIQTLTFGCENAPSRCSVLTPVGDRDPVILPTDPGLGTYTASVLFNHSLDHLDVHTGVGRAVRAADTTNSTPSFGVVHAVWSLSGNGGGGTNPVPIPSTVYLLLIGLAALMFRRQR